MVDGLELETANCELKADTLPARSREGSYHRVLDDHTERTPKDHVRDHPRRR